MKPGNSGGAKAPDFWSAFEDGEDRVIGDEPAAPEKIRILQRKLYRKAKAEPEYRFYLVYDKICREDILRHAYDLAPANAESPGVDGVTFAAIEKAGIEAWLAGLRKELTEKTYRPAPVRRGEMPQPRGAGRPPPGPTTWRRHAPAA